MKESEPSEPSKPVTVHRTGRSDRGPDGSMLFSHVTVPYLKPTVNMNGSRVFRSDRTVRSGFNNLRENTFVGVFQQNRFGFLEKLLKHKCYTKTLSKTYEILKNIFGFIL